MTSKTDWQIELEPAGGLNVVVARKFLAGACQEFVSEVPDGERGVRARQDEKWRCTSPEECRTQQQIAPPARRLWVGAFAPTQSRSGQSAFPNRLDLRWCN